MTEPHASRTGRILSLRKGVLLATVAGLGLGVLVFGDYGAQSTLPGLSSPAYAQSAPSGPVGFADIVEKVKPAVISVRVKTEVRESMRYDGNNWPFPPGSQLDRFFRRFGLPDMPNGPQQQGPRGPQRHEYSLGQGSGFFISADGYAVTNNHVVDKGDIVDVITDDGKTYTAKVIGTDSRTDLALIKVEGNGDFPYVHFADKEPRIGDWVIAVGNPFGLGGTVTAGIVSARGRDIGAGPYDDFIQIDAPVNKGNSGGPTFDTNGNVIGVNTAIYSPSGGSVGIAFAIPAETVKGVVQQLRDKGTVTRGWIGVQIQSVNKDIAGSLGLDRAQGALVSQPQADSPAVAAGIKAGDVIVSVNGRTVRDARALARTIGGMAPGTKIELGIKRDGKDQTISMTLGELPKERQQASLQNDQNDQDEGTTVPGLGLTLAPAGSVSGAGSEGVVITGVDSDSVAAARQLKTGDVILEIGGKPVSTPDEVRKVLDAAQSEGKNTILVRVKSDTGAKFVVLPVERG